MSRWSCTVGSRRHGFDSLRELMAKATPRRSGDELAGVAAASAEERAAAQLCLADVPLALFLKEPLVPYETDEITRLILDTHDAAAFAPAAALTVGGFRDWCYAMKPTLPCWPRSPPVSRPRWSPPSRSS